MQVKLLIILATSSVLYVSTSYSQPVPPCAIGAFVVITPRSAHPSEGDRLQVLGVSTNSPAARSGLVAGQIIRAINGVPTAGLKLADCVRRIQGKAGTTVVLDIEDKRHGWTNSVEVTREFVANDPLAVDANSFVDPDSQESISLSLSTNQVARITSKNGEIAVVQFTRFGVNDAAYRWRSHSTSSDEVKYGTGIVFENYDSHPDAFGGNLLTHNGSPDDLYVKAGAIKLQWSKGGPSFGWLYYDPAEEKVEVIDASAFDSYLK